MLNLITYMVKSVRRKPGQSQRGLVLYAGAVALVMGLLLNGCGGYRIGPPSGIPARQKTVYVAPFVNNTLEPRVGDAVTQALRKRLSQEGTYRLVTKTPADVTISGTLARYDRRAVAYEHKDVVTARDFEVIVTARVTVTYTDGSQPSLEREVHGRATFRIGPDQTTSERLALPSLADDLAHRIASLVTDGSW